MTDSSSSRDGRGAADPFDAIERLTPSPAVAIAGMRPAYLEVFRRASGPGARELALLTWATWSTCLRDGHGVRVAARRAEDVAATTRRLHVRPLARLWVTPGQVRIAARQASRVAVSCR